MSFRSREPRMTLAIDVHGLNKSFGAHHVVKDVSLQVEQGHITGFLGPNGSGKTTTLRMLCGLLTADSGSGQVLGLDFPGQADAIKLQTGYMTQRFSLYEDLTIEENLAFIARVYSLPDVSRRVDEALDRLGLGARRKQLAGQLSSTGSGSARAASNWRASCRAVGSSASRWPPRRCTSPGCCCSTSRPQASTRRRGAISGTRSTRSPTAASPCWSRPITWTKPSAATTSPISSTAS
jgi:hypothetical protein